MSMAALAILCWAIFAAAGIVVGVALWVKHRNKGR